MRHTQGIDPVRKTLADLLPAAIFWSVLSFHLVQFLLVELIRAHMAISPDTAAVVWGFILEENHPARLAGPGFLELIIGWGCFLFLRRYSVEGYVLQPGRFGTLSIYLAAFSVLVIPELIYELITSLVSAAGQETPDLIPAGESPYFPANQLLGVFLTVVVIAPVIEEFLFRGFLMTSLKARGLANWLVVVLSAIGFAILHLHYTGFGMFLIFVLGVMLGYMRVWSGGIVLPIAAHAAFNAKSFLFSYLNAVG